MNAEICCDKNVSLTIKCGGEQKYILVLVARQAYLKHSFHFYLIQTEKMPTSAAENVALLHKKCHAR